MPRLVYAVVIATLSGACEGGVSAAADGSDSTTGNPDPHATILADVIPSASCDRVGAIAIVLVATLVDCVQQPPAPCTLPTPPREYVGDRLGCPSSEPSTTLGTEVGLSGRYLVEARTELDDGSSSSECHAGDGDLEVLVTAADIDERAQITTVATGQPCPDP